MDGWMDGLLACSCNWLSIHRTQQIEINVWAFEWMFDCLFSMNVDIHSCSMEKCTKIEREEKGQVLCGINHQPSRLIPVYKTSQVPFREGKLEGFAGENLES